MSTLTPIQKRAARKNRNQTMVDMNLVSLIDVFTILIFFLLSSASGVELISSPKAVKLPVSTTDTAPKQTVVVTVTDADILVEGRLVASVAQVLATEGDVIAPLKEGKMTGDQIAFTAGGTRYTGTVTDKAITGKANTGGKEADWTATR